MGHSAITLNLDGAPAPDTDKRVDTDMSNQEIVTLLKDALENQDIDAIWYVIAELSKVAK